MEKKNLLEVKNLTLSFGKQVVAKDICFSLRKGEAMGIVGESGSGKTISSLALMGLLPVKAKIISGEIIFHSDQGMVDVLKLSQKEWQAIRGKEIAMIFQDPLTALNPSITCGKQVEEIVRLHLKLPKQKAKEKVLALFQKVNLVDIERIFNAYPHQLSGGQRQRVMIAMGISCNPKILIADEPTTALDVTVQKSILELIRSLQLSEDMGILFISHDLGVISEVAQQVMVMQQGNVVESGEINAIFTTPKENYTKGLLACKPNLEVKYKRLPTVSSFLKNEPFIPIVQSEEERVARKIKLYSQPPLLEVKNLSKYFHLSKGLFSHKKTLTAVDNISFCVYPGETLGLVGESGSGKTTISRTILLLEKPSAGEIFYEGRDLTQLSKSDMRLMRKNIQIIFQDPYSSLNPKSTVATILTEPMLVHNIGHSHKERLQQATEILLKVGLKESDLHKYPHEFSGGQRQRIGIARSLVLSPKFIICDESVSALDISVQAQILNLLNELKDEFGFTYIFISHDLNVVNYMSDNLLVLNKGKIEEMGDAQEIYNNPTKEYTKKLIEAIPKIIQF